MLEKHLLYPRPKDLGPEYKKKEERLKFLRNLFWFFTFHWVTEWLVIYFPSLFILQTGLITKKSLTVKIGRLIYNQGHLK